MKFPSRLWTSIQEKGSPAVVGLDPRPQHLPEPFHSMAKNGLPETMQALTQYHSALLDVLAPKISAIKPQAAFFEQFGADGFHALADTVAAAKDRGLLVILDVKRGDIGSTSTAYANAFLGGANNSFPPADALTINPYLGEDACQPFIEAARKQSAGLFFLVKTSNPGAGLFQEHGTPPLADIVAKAVSRWGQSDIDESGWSAVGAVVGATRPHELAHFRSLMPKSPFLLPGFGHQGGGASGLEPAFSNGMGAIVNSSRGILWAHERKDLAHIQGWQNQVDAALNEMIEALKHLSPQT